MLKFLIFCIFPLTIFSQDNLFQQAQNSLSSKYYSTSIELGFKGIQHAAQNITSQTIRSLPYMQFASVTNSDYSIDLYNKNSHFNVQVDYVIPSQGNLNISLQYAFETVRYYHTYITESKKYTFPGVDYEVIDLKEKGSFLWNRKENTAYYVYIFNQVPSKNLLKTPGVLLQVNFTSAQQIARRDMIMLDLIEKTNWDQLTTLFR